MDVTSFISEHSTLIIILGSIIVIILIGFIAQKTNVGKKVLFKDKKEEEKTINPSLDLNKPLLDKPQEKEVTPMNPTPVIDATGLGETPIKTDIFDKISANFNDTGLSLTDVNENPAASNEDLGLTEDLYVPFGDKEEEKPVELKIEDVNENDDFQIIEPQKNEDGQVVAPTEEEIAKLSQPLTENITTTLSEEDTTVAEKDNEEKIKNTEENNEELPQEYVDEINNIVDQTFVINDATDESNQTMVEESGQIQDEQNIVNDEISNETTDETSDFDFEATTTLKLDEINEQIRNLQLEDLDNNEDLISEKEEKREKKNISIKSIDDIINEKNSQN